MADDVSSTAQTEPFRSSSPSPSEEGAGRVRMLPVRLIDARQQQVRSTANERVGLEALKASIREDGFNSAILVRAVEERFEVIAGHRRLIAAIETGQVEVPCIVEQGLDDRDLLVRQIRENLLREDLQPVELAEGFARVMEKSSGMDQKDVARLFNVSPQRFGELLKLARLPRAIKDVLMDRRLSEALAVQMAGLYEAYRSRLPKEETAIERTATAIARCARDEWTVSRTRAVVAREKQRVGAARRRKPRARGPDDGAESSGAEKAVSKKHRTDPPRGRAC